MVIIIVNGCAITDDYIVQYSTVQSTVACFGFATQFALRNNSRYCEGQIMQLVTICGKKIGVFGPSFITEAL